MNKLQAASIGIVIGMFFGTLEIINAGEREIEKKEAIMESIQVYQPRKTITVDDKFAEWNSVPHAPYDFIALDPTMQIYLEERCSDLEMDFFYVAALMDSESSFDEHAISKDGRDKGLMQIRDINWDFFETEYGLDVDDPFENMECGLLMISRLVEKYGEEEAIQLYKCGEFGGARLWDEGYRHPSIEDILKQRDAWKGEANGKVTETY